MSDRFDWRWLLRRKCRAIACTEQFLTVDGDHGISVTLCKRWRWHRGECDG